MAMGEMDNKPNYRFEKDDQQKLSDLYADRLTFAFQLKNSRLYDTNRKLIDHSIKGAARMLDMVGSANRVVEIMNKYRDGATS